MTKQYDDLPIDYFHREALHEAIQTTPTRHAQVLRGATLHHNQIRGNIFAYLKFACRGQHYRPFLRDLGIWSVGLDHITYPDILVVTGHPQFYKQRTDVVTNPLLVIEVVDQSLHAFDSGAAFKMYRSIPSLQEYIVISQDKMQVEQLRKTTEDIWVFQEYNHLKAAVWLTSVDLEIPLSEIYYGLDSPLKALRS